MRAACCSTRVTRWTWRLFCAPLLGSALARLPVVERVPRADLHGRHGFPGPRWRRGYGLSILADAASLPSLSVACSWQSFVDVIQISVFKATGKRVFRMAPCHHFSMGWKEVTIVIRFLADRRDHRCHRHLGIFYARCLLDERSAAVIIESWGKSGQGAANSSVRDWCVKRAAGPAATLFFDEGRGRLHPR